MNRRSIKQMKRDIVLRPIKRMVRFYWDEAGRALVGSIIFVMLIGGLFIIAGSI